VIEAPSAMDFHDREDFSAVFGAFDHDHEGFSTASRSKVFTIMEWGS